ncbi:hypothetical protein IJ750_03425 [bacterium]|nr:hypothetical protein [bacterium]
MKKFLSFVLLFLAINIPQVFASEIDVLPTMQSKSNVQDRVWVGTFQIVWNELMDRVTFGEVKFIEGNPENANLLNKREFSTSNISDKCYYKYMGKISKRTKGIIEKGIKKKFNEKSDILDQIDWSPRNESYIIYAMLKKDFQFVNAFDKLGKSKFKDKKTDYFGINRRSDDKLGKGVRVLFYNSPEDYAVVLDTTSNDEVILYKTPTSKSFDLIYEDLIKKRDAYRGNTGFAHVDELKIPNIKFFEEKQFSELTGRRIKGTNLKVDKALETVKFEMNNQGVKLKSEAAMTMMLTSAGPGRIEHPRKFYFDDTFVMFLIEKGRKTPYFALRVFDISKFTRG